MLREFKGVRQESNQSRRRWFECDALSFIVWYDNGNTLVGFQILYRHGGSERALTWKPQRGFSHSRVDQGDDSPFKNLAPVLVADGAVPWSTVENLFLEHSPSLETELRNLVLTRLKTRG